MTAGGWRWMVAACATRTAVPAARPAVFVAAGAGGRRRSAGEPRPEHNTQNNLRTIATFPTALSHYSDSFAAPSYLSAHAMSAPATKKQKAGNGDAVPVGIATEADIEEYLAEAVKLQEAVEKVL